MSSSTCSCDLQLQNVPEKDVKTFLEKWTDINKTEHALFFYKSLFEMYPETKKFFVKFNYTEDDQLHTNKAAVKQANATWGAITHLHECLTKGDVKSVNAAILWLAELHVKIKTFKVEMFELSIEPFCKTVQQFLGQESVVAFKTILRVVLDACMKKYNQIEEKMPEATV